MNWGNVEYIDLEHPEEWPSHLYERRLLGALPDMRLRQVASQLAAVGEPTIGVAFKRLMVRIEIERRDQEFTTQAIDRQGRPEVA